MNRHRRVCGEIQPFEKQPPHIHRCHVGSVNRYIGNHANIIHAIHICRNGRLKRQASA